MALALLDRRALCWAAAAATIAYHFVKLVPLRKGFSNLPLSEQKIGGLAGYVGGHAVDQLWCSFGSAHKCFQIWVPKPLQRVGHLQYLRKHWIHCGHPDDIMYMLSTNADNYEKAEMYRLMFSYLIKESLVGQMDLKVHAVHRKLLSPAFSPGALKHIADTVVPKHAERLLKALGNRSEQTFAIEEDIGATTLRVMAEAVFKTTSLHDAEEVLTAFHKVLHNLWILPRMIPGTHPFLYFYNKPIQEAKAFFHQKVQEIVKQLKESGEVPSERTTAALIDYLVFSGEFSDEALVDHSTTFMYAGHDTANLTLGWMTYLLSTNIHVQDKLYEELRDVIGAGAVCKVDELKNCKYLVYCIKETLRLYPAGACTLRVTAEDDVLPGTKTFIPKGTDIAASFWVAHRCPDIWGPDVDEFRPERWEEDELATLPFGGEGAYFPFSAGAHSCIGKDFAMNELLILSAPMYRNYRFTWPQGEPEPWVECIPATRPVKPLRVQIAPRVE